MSCLTRNFLNYFVDVSGTGLGQETVVQLIEHETERLGIEQRLLHKHKRHHKKHKHKHSCHHRKHKLSCHHSKCDKHDKHAKKHVNPVINAGNSRPQIPAILKDSTGQSAQSSQSSQSAIIIPSPAVVQSLTQPNPPTEQFANVAADSNASIASTSSKL